MYTLLMKKVLLLNPPGKRGLFRDTVCSALSKASYVWKPRGHIQVSSIIPLDWDVAFLDASINQQTSQYCLEFIDDYKPDLIITALSSIVWNDDLDFVSGIKKKFPNIHITVFGDALREKYFFDTVLQVADEAFLDPYTYDIENYAQKKFRDFRLLCKEKVDKRPRPVKTICPRHELFDNKKYRWPFSKHFRYAAVYTQFGCPYSCSYCTSGRSWVSCRSPESVLDELRLLKIQDYKELHFGDDTFGSPKENATIILKTLINEGLRFSWSAYTYPGIADRTMLELMKQSGCHTLVVGIDSHDFGLLKHYGRMLNQDTLIRFLKNCKELKIEVCGDFILGFEEEDAHSVRKTIAFALSCGVDYASFNSANPLFATAIRDHKKSAGLIQEDSCGFDTAGYCIPDTQKLAGQELQQLRAMAVKRFYFRPGYILKRLSRVRSFEEFVMRATDGYGVFKNALETRFQHKHP
jgi:anaerobic magnesium-protoporphyrin IX monomethyl ester cyclase